MISIATFRSASPFIHFLFPRLLQKFSIENIPSSFIQLASVIIGSGVRSPLILGVHTDLGWILACQGSSKLNYWKNYYDKVYSYSGSKPSLIAFCLFCCLCLSFNSFSCNDRLSKYLELWDRRTYVIILSLDLFLKVILLSLKFNNLIPELLSLFLQIL